MYVHVWSQSPGIRGSMSVLTELPWFYVLHIYSLAFTMYWTRIWKKKTHDSLYMFTSWPMDGETEHIYDNIYDHIYIYTYTHKHNCFERYESTWVWTDVTLMCLRWCFACVYNVCDYVHNRQESSHVYISSFYNVCIIIHMNIFVHDIFIRVIGILSC